MVWLYLQIFGPSVERLLSEKCLWMFTRDDFEKAALFLLLKNPTSRDSSAVEMRKLISNHFESEMELTQWAQYLNEKVQDLYYYL